MTFPMGHISASFVKAYTACHKKGLLYRKKAENSIDPKYAEAGTIVHNSIERIFDPGAEVYEPKCDLIDDEAAKRIKESLEGFRMIFKRNKKRMENSIPEYYFIWNPEKDVDFIGFIDLYKRDRERIFIDDWKTGAESQKDELQLKLYKAAISDLTGVPPRNITATLHYLRQAKSKEVLGGNPGDMKRWLSVNVIAPIREGDWSENRKECANCEYRKACGKN